MQKNRTNIRLLATVSKIHVLFKSIGKLCVSYQLYCRICQISVSLRNGHLCNVVTDELVCVVNCPDVGVTATEKDVCWAYSKHWSQTATSCQLLPWLECRCNIHPHYHLLSFLVQLTFFHPVAVIAHLEAVHTSMLQNPMLHLSTPSLATKLHRTTKYTVSKKHPQHFLL